MKKQVAATLSVLSLLSFSAVPTMAQDHGDHDFNGQKIKVHFSKHQDANLTDIQGNWAEAYILDLIEKGVLSGVDSQHFHPNQSVTRAQWAVMVSRYFGLTNTTTTQDFTDVPTSSWEYPYVEATKNYFDAYRDLNGQLQYHPDAATTRQDVTVTLVKILAKLDPSIQIMDSSSANTLLQQQFSDWNLINSNLRPYVATAVQYNLIHGDGQGHFLPLNSLTRAEAATLLDLLLENGIVVDGDGGTGGTTTTWSNSTALTTINTAVVTGINNTNHLLTIQNGTTVGTLKSDLLVDSGRGHLAVYTDTTRTTLAADASVVTPGMVVVATAQDGTTQSSYTIALTTPLRNVTTLTTSNNAVVTSIDNTNLALTLTTGTNVQTLKNSLAVDGGHGSLAVYTNSTKSTLAANTATVNTAMVLVATAQDGTTQTVYTIHLTTPLRNVTTLTTLNNTVVTDIDNSNRVLHAEGAITVQTLENDLKVDGGNGTIAIYTDNTLSTLASAYTPLTNTMVLVATAQDGVTQATYTIVVPTPPSHVTALSTSDSSVVTGIDNNYHALTVANGTTVATLKQDLIVDSGNGTLNVYTDKTATTPADDSTTLTNTMVVVATAQDGTTKTTYTITL